MYSADVMYLTKAYDGVAEALAALKAKGMKIGVVTNKPHEIAKGVVKQLFPNIEFDSLEGGRPDVPHKPAPAMLMKMLVDFGISYRECAYFGDTKVDMTVGSRAEVKVAGTHFYDVICATEKGMYFWYLKDFESNGFQDNVDWQAYTEWEDLVNEKSVIKNVINPRMTAMGELVDENGNPINGQ